MINLLLPILAVYDFITVLVHFCLKNKIQKHQKHNQYNFIYFCYYPILTKGLRLTIILYNTNSEI